MALELERLKKAIGALERSLRVAGNRIELPNGRVSIIKSRPL